MRLNEIILEQQQRDNAYDNMMVETNIAFWSTLVRNESLPLSESVMTENMNTVTARLYATAAALPENKLKEFWEMLENPMIDEDLVEGILGDAAKKVGGAALNTLAKVGDTAQAAKKAVGGAVLKGAKAVGSYAKDVYTNRVPLDVQEKIKQMGAQAIQMVKEGIQRLADAGTMVLKALNNLVKKFSKADPCMQTNESIIAIKNILSENTVPTQYFTGTKSGLLDKLIPTLDSVEGGLPTKLAKAISEIKKSGTDVYGRDARGIAIDIVSKGVGGINANEAAQIANKGLNDNQYFPMSKYFKDNGIKPLIARFDGGASGTGEGSCEIPVEAQNSLINKVFGPDTEVYKALDKVGAINLLKGLTDEIEKHPGTFIISVISAIVTIASGAGALRIASVIFGSVLPMLGNTYVEYLKTNNAPEEKIKFAEKVVSALRGIATIAQIINIADIAAKGWESLASKPVPEAKIPTEASELVGVANVSHEMSDLSTKAQDILTDWTKADGNLELSPKTVQSFFDNASTHMTPEQFKAFDALVVDAKVHGTSYEKLIHVLENPDSNGVIDIDMAHQSVEHVASAADVADPSLTTDLSTEKVITQQEILKAAGLDSDALDKYKTDTMLDYAKENFGSSTVRTIQGNPLSQEEYEAMLKAVPDYTENPMSVDAQKYLEQFADRKEEITKATYQAIAAEKGIKLPTDYSVDNQITLPTDPDAADAFDADFGDLPDFNSFDGLDPEDAKYVYHALGKENTEEIARMVYNGQIDPSQVRDLIDSGIAAGQSEKHVMDAIRHFDTTQAAADIVPTETPREVPSADLDKPLEPKAPTEAPAATTPETIQAIGTDLQSSEMMKGFDNHMSDTVGNKIMKDYTSNPEFAKAWDSAGFDKEGYIKKVATDNGWFEPMDKAELIKDLKAGGIDSPEAAQKVGGQIQNSYSRSQEFRAKWDGMSDTEQKDYIAGLKAQVDEIAETEKLAATIMDTDPKVASLNHGAQKYLDGILRTDKDTAAAWSTMDDSAKEAVIAKAQQAAKFQNALLNGTMDAMKNGVTMDGNEILEFGSAVADGNYSPEQIAQLQKLSNLAYGDKSIEFRKAVASAMNSGDKTALKSVLDAAV